MRLCRHMLFLSCCCLVAQLSPTLSATLWTVARQASLFMGFPRREHWSGLPFPSPGDLPDPGVEYVSPVLVGGFFTTEPPGKPCFYNREDKQQERQFSLRGVLCRSPLTGSVLGTGVLEGLACSPWGSLESSRRDR